MANKKQKPSSTQDAAPHTHPISSAIDSYLHWARDSQHAAGKSLKPVINDVQKGFKTLRSDVRKANRLLKEPSTEEDQIRAQRIFFSVNRRLDRLRGAEPWEVLTRSLFIGLFSGYDAFIGKLFTAIYMRKPELFNGIQRTIPLTTVLSASSLDEIKRCVLEEELDTLRRKSYIDQFEALEKTFGLALRKFDQWPQFVECAQRRNILTHCDGKVTKQYVQICEAAGYRFNITPALGTDTEVDIGYFFESSELMMEVAVMLGHTLWRKVLPEETSEADRHLHGLTYNALALERWDRAKSLGAFGTSDAVRKNSSDLDDRIGLINYAIALKFGEEPQNARKLVESVDWSAARPELQLASFVLLDQHETAAELMRKIGKETDLIGAAAYYEWPLFRSFRESPEFLRAYAEVYGHSFIKDVKKNAQKTEQTASKALGRVEQEFPENIDTEGLDD